jgi:hypothetical protein
VLELEAGKENLRRGTVGVARSMHAFYAFNHVSEAQDLNLCITIHSAV